MGLLDFFKKKEKRKRLESVQSEKPPVSAEKKEASEKSRQSQTARALGSSKKAALILQKPKITEKSSVLSENGVYVFQVEKDASKQEIKKTVGELYQVGVEKVNVITVPSRKRRVGRVLGRKPGYKKALVKLSKGQKIEFI